MTRPAPVLVTGATGFLGRPLVRALLAAGHPVTAVARRVATLPPSPGLKRLALDLEDLGAIGTLAVQDRVICHLAAARSHPRTSRRELLAINVAATTRLAERAARGGARAFLHLSTALIHGDAEADGPRAEEDVASPGLLRRSVYLDSKLRGRQALLGMRSELPTLAIVAPSIVLGPAEPGTSHRLAPWGRRLLRSRVLVTPGAGASPRDLAARDDVLAVLVRLAKEPIPGEWILSGPARSPRELAAELLEAAGESLRLHVSVPLPLARWTARALDRATGQERGTGWSQALELFRRSWRFSDRRAREELGYATIPFPEALATWSGSLAS